MIARGDVRGLRLAAAGKRRPVLVVGPRDVLPSLSQIVVIPMSSQIRGLPWEVVLDVADGVPGRCTLKPEWIRAVPRTTIGPWIGALPETRWREVRSAVLAALGLDETSAR